MAQHDYDLANQSRTAFRADLNNALLAIATQNSGATAPSTTYAGMVWWDTAANLIKVRNSANTGWVTVASYDGTTYIPYRAGSPLGTAATQNTGTSGEVVPILNQDAAFSSAFALSGVLSPAQITADQNDYNPTGLSTANTLRINSDAARNLTGLAGGAAGRLFAVHNVGSFAITLKDESASSTAANRFALTADLALAADQMVLLQYDATSSRWRAVSTKSGVGDHEVVVHTGNGFGSTNTRIRRYTTTQSSVGTAITYADSATDGASFTINVTDLYFISYSDHHTTSNTYHGISVNSTQLTTDITGITAADRVAVTSTAAGSNATASCVVKLAAGDVVRPHRDSIAQDTAAAFANVFRIRRIASV